MRDFIKDSVDQSTVVRFVNSSGPVTNVNENTAGLELKYRREGGSVTNIGPVNDLASADAPHNDAGIIHLWAGYYRVDLPDAAIASGAESVEVIPSALGLTGIGSHHNLVEAASAGAGTGARTVTVTVTDGTDPLEGARVRMTKAAESYVGSTNASGQVVFNLDDGTWTVGVSLAGYSFAGTTLVVNGVETPTYAMTAVTLTPSEPGFVTGYFTVYDENGDPEAGVEIRCAATHPPRTIGGAALDGEERTATSDINGLAQFAGLCKGATYTFYRGTSTRAFPTLIPTTASASYPLPSIIGQP